MRSAHEAETRGKITQPDPRPTEEEVLRVQKFLSFPPKAQEKALAYLENLNRYLAEEE